MAEYLHWLSRPCTSATICQVIEGNDGRSRETLGFLLIDERGNDFFCQFFITMVDDNIHLQTIEH